MGSENMWPFLWFLSLGGPFAGFIPVVARILSWLLFVVASFYTVCVRHISFIHQWTGIGLFPPFAAVSRTAASSRVHVFVCTPVFSLWGLYQSRSPGSDDHSC